MALTNQQKQFAAHYIACWNATRAAKDAGYSAKTAYSQGQRLLKNVEIRKEIERILTDAAMSANEVLARLTHQAEGDLTDFLKVTEKDGKQTTDFDFLTAQKTGKLGLVRKIKIGKDGISLELYDAQKALQLLAKYHRLIDRAGENGDEGDEEPEDDIGEDELLVEAELIKAKRG